MGRLVLTCVVAAAFAVAASSANALSVGLARSAAAIVPVASGMSRQPSSAIERRDGDGLMAPLQVASTHGPIGDCDDTNPNVYPGAPEIAGNGIDDNCNGLADEASDGTPSDNGSDTDSDGVSIAAGDCNDNNPAVHVGATEVIGDRIDNDCNGLADEDALGNPSTDAQDHDGDGLPMSNDVIFYDGVEP